VKIVGDEFASVVPLRTRLVALVRPSPRVPVSVDHVPKSGETGGESVFDTAPPAKFWYRGNAWFVPHALKWMSRNDR
jgi:hypothetical protein